MALIDRNYDNVRLTGFVRNVPQRSGPILNMFLPDVAVQTRHFSIRIGQRVAGAATYRAFDTPSPVTAREGFVEKTGALPPISEMTILGEEDRLGIYERAIRGDFDQAVEAQIYNDAARLVGRIVNRYELAKGEVLSTGKLSLDENGLIGQEADFGVPVGNFVAPAGALWSTTATADPLADLRAWNEKSLDENGTPLRYAIMAPARVSNLLASTKVREFLGANGLTPAIATRGQVQDLFNAHGLPTIVEYGYKVNGAAVIDPTLVVLMPEVSTDEFGRFEHGVTAEALELDLAFTDQPGLAGLIMRNEDPVQVMTKVAGIGMPVLHNPGALYVADVA